jgi:hypothetical protein
VAIRHRLGSLLDAPRLIAALLAVQDDVRTNLRPPELRRLVTLTSQLKDPDIREATIDATLLDRLPAPDGNYFLVPKDSTYRQLHTSIGATIAS